MRLAFIDLLFNWPPHGGACTDLYHTAAELQRLGHDVHLFIAGYERAWERGKVENDALPFPHTRLDFTPRTFNRRALPARFRHAVDAWNPDAVYLCDAFSLKPYLAEALEHYPCISRFYAYEATCPRNFHLTRGHARCSGNYLQTPDACRRCALQALAPEIATWHLSAWSHEYLAARAFMPGYYDRLVRSLKQARAVLVYNALMKQQLEYAADNVHIVPGGVELKRFPQVPPPSRAPGERKVIFMAGHAEDPAKGMPALRAAGEVLARERDDFEIHVTHPDWRLDTRWFRAVGWEPQEATVRRYQQSDICVAPSAWDEPFGLVAVEAMATGRPVCASRVGGLAEIVVDGETGLLFEPGDAGALAKALRRLLDDAALRARMGAAGRKRAETEYDWRRVVARHHMPIIEEAVR